MHISSRPNKYRRAFDWRLSEGQDDRTLENYRGMVRLASSDLPDIIEDFLAISRKRSQNPTAISRLQVHMLEELLLQESAVKHYRDNLQELRNNVATTDESKLKKKISFAESEMFFHRMYANAIRVIGDGIAWRAFAYDRAAMRLLGERATKQHLSSEGTMQELREWSYHFERGTGIAVLNALTNCLAIGDVTVVRHDGSAEVVEVKTSKVKSSRTIRQKQAMREVVTLISSGEGKNENRDIHIEILPVTPESSFGKVEELLDTAGSKGWAARRISDCLYVEAFDFRKIESSESLEKVTEEVRRHTVGSWESQGDFVVNINTLDLIQYTPNCAPFSIFPFKAKTCMELLIGAKFYIGYLNHSAVAREFQKRGWEIEKDIQVLMKEGEGAPESVLNVRKGPFHCTVAPGDFLRLQIETLRPKSLIDGLEAMLRRGPTDNEGYTLALYEHESKIWN